MPGYFLLLILAGLVFSDAGAENAAGTHPSPGLDQALIQSEYVNGEFEKVQLEIARFQSQNSRYSRSDSLCIARHLAVIHAANPLTVEVGKHWMHELFKIDSMATLNDMYVSEEIERIFNKVRSEFMARRKPQAAPSSQPIVSAPVHVQPAESSPARPHSGTPPNSAWKKPTYWILGGAVVAAAATTAIVLLAAEDGEPGEPREIFVPKGKEEQ